MNSTATPQFKKQLNKIIKKNPQLKQKFIKQTNLFQQNPRHPSLKTHKLSGKQSTQYAFWIEANLRIVFIISNNTAIFTNILTHDQY